MSPEDDESVAKAGQLPAEVHGNLVTLVEVNAEAASLKLLCYIANKNLVWLQTVELVNNGCL